MVLRSKKGIYYTFDALLASLLLVSVIVLLFNTNYYEPTLDVSIDQTHDVLTVLQSLHVDELSATWLEAEINSSEILDPSISVLDQIGTYWAQNKTENATALFMLALQEVIGSLDNVALRADGDELFTKGTVQYDSLVASSRMISGIEKGKAVTGSSSSAYLKKIRNKKTSSYAYLGGYVGQGNITVQLDIPVDFIASDSFVDAKLKLETPGNFTLKINGVVCGGLYEGLSSYVSEWSLNSCNASFMSGTNNISFYFTSLLNTSAISGGFLKVTFLTDTLQEATVDGYAQYNFPSISGFINLYDSFATQGSINSYFVNLTLYNEYDTFLTIGNETILYVPGSNVTKTVTYSAINQSLAPTQIPLRLGTTNLSNITVINAGVATDSFLVTDVSGSMGDCGSYYSENVTYCAYEYHLWNWWWLNTECPYTGTCAADECSTGWSTRNHNVYDKTVTTCNQTLMDIAKSADKLFVDTVLTNSTLNEVGLVDFSSNANTPTTLTNVQGTLTSEIDTYAYGGATCTCCGINRAKDLLLSSSDEKFMIVLSDGEPTRYCSGFSDYTGSSGNNAQSQQDAIDSGQEACANNITVYTIGFGSSMSATGHSVMQQTACNSSLYYNATDVSDLAQIYEDISNSILLAANYTSQTINIQGNYSVATLQSGSYIDLYYDPIVANNSPGQLSVTFESEQFSSCDATIELPTGLTISDAAVTSFSSNHWTKSLLVNDVEVFNVTDYSTEYPTVGDPFLIQIPSFLLKEGVNNTFSLVVGDSPTNSTLCSENNTLIYSGLVDAVTPRSSAFEKYVGCSWTIESENNKLFNLSVPQEYLGSNVCEYSSTNISYALDDAYDVATYSLLKQLDPDANGKIIVDLEENDLEITITLVNGVPYLWGPSLVSFETWS